MYKPGHYFPQNGMMFFILSNETYQCADTFSPHPLSYPGNLAYRLFFAQLFTKQG